jgi:amino acid transporter
VLTVAVSIASGIANLASAIPAMHGHNVLFCIIAILGLTIVNLRGIKESAAVFALPTYCFIFLILTMLGTGAYQYWHGTLHVVHDAPTPEVSALGWFIILKAFASGCAAMTGVEAISDGIPTFQKPESKNAAATLGVLVSILAVMFIGITFLAHAMGIGVRHDLTVLAQISQGVFGGGVMFYLVQFATMMILVLAANTSYADFPRLSGFIARDGFLPRQLASLGDRLVFSNGIIMLGVLASVLIIFFQGDTHALIPLYAVGVFLSVTLSQAGMVRRWYKERSPGWQWKMGLNASGALATAVVAVIIASTKFLDGAWIVIALIPCFVALFVKIRRHYSDTNSQLSLADISPEAEANRPVDNTVLILIGTVHRGVVGSLPYIRSLGSDVRAVYIDINGDGGSRMKDIWATWGQAIPLVVLESPYRSITEPLIDYVRQLQTNPDKVVTVVLPEFVTSRWWESALHNQTAFLIKWALLFCRRRVAVCSVPQFLE